MFFLQVLEQPLVAVFGIAAGDNTLAVILDICPCKFRSEVKDGSGKVDPQQQHDNRAGSSVKTYCIGFANVQANNEFPDHEQG